MLESYETIRGELALYGNGIEEKAETIIVTKTDLVTKEELDEKINILRKKNPSILTVSLLDENAIKNLKRK